MWVGFHRHIFLPGREELFYLFLCGASGVCGQFLLTIGFRYVTAVEGSIISALRILLAALLGPILALRGGYTFEYYDSRARVRASSSRQYSKPSRTSWPSRLR